MSNENIKLEIIKGVEGRSVYINDYRVAGNKPWGGGDVIDSFETSIKYFLKALNICPVQKISQLEKENAELKARLAHVESELKKSDETLEYYAGEGDHRTYLDIFDHIKMESEGVISFDSDKFAERARQRIKERKGFEG